MDNNQVELQNDEMKDFLKHIISTNKIIQEEGKNNLSVEVIGESGLGKTSTVIQLADELNLNFVKLNLAQIEELGDLVGFPIRQFKMVKESGMTAEPKMKEVTEIVKKQVKMKKMVDGKLVDEVIVKEVPVKKMVPVEQPGLSSSEVWVDETAVEEYRSLGYSFAKGDNKRMSYCPPEWIAGADDRGGILLLDDWNRADIRFIQAVMELVDRGEYISWKLPKNWTILLTANPDNGDYIVNSIDVAQRTRFASVQLKFDAEAWAKWAERNSIDGRCINFLLMNPEIITQRVNPRSITNFFNGIGTIKDFDKELGLIQMLGESMVGPETAILFSQFIANKLDRLITPKEILSDPSDKSVIDALTDLLYEDGDYRADLASVFSNRIVNYALVYAEKNTIDQPIIKRLTALIKDEDLFQYDLKYVMAKRLIGGNKQKFQKLVLDSTVSELVTA